MTQHYMDCSIPVSSCFQTGGVSPEYNSQPFPGPLGVTTGLLLATSEQMNWTWLTGRTEAELGRIGRAQGGEDVSLKPQYPASGLGSDQF